MPHTYGNRALRSATLTIGAFVASAWLIVAALAWRDYKTMLDRSEAETKLAASSIQNHIGTLLNTTEQIANSVARTYRERGAALRFDSVYHRELGALLLDFGRDLVSISLTDKQGRLIATTVQFPAPDIGSVSDRDYFTAFLAGHRDVFASRTTRGRISGVPVFNLAYPVNEVAPPDFIFGGAVIVSIRPSVVIRTLEDAGLKAKTSLVLLDEKYRPVLTVAKGELVESDERILPPPGDMTDRPVIFNRMSQDETLRDVWMRLSPEIIARITLSEQDLLALWRRNVLENSLVAVLLTALAFIVMTHIRRLLRLLDREHVKRTISEDNLRFRVADLEATRHDLEIARANAEKANAAKTDFLAAMSHEIRTPMNGILGFIDLLRRSPLNEQQGAYMRRVIDASKSLQAILDEILDFSKIEAGHVRITADVFDLYELVEGVAEWAHAQITRPNLGISYHLPSDVPRFVIGDAHRLRQVLINLVSNALKFTQQGMITIDVRETVRGPEMIELRFSVSDTGSGIAADDQTVLFKPFYQVDRPTKPARGGTGLGLAICRQLIEIQGGQIGVISAPEQGSEFWFTLEFRLPINVMASQPAKPSHEKRITGPARKILVVDDVAMNRELMSAILESAGFDVIEAESGRRALRIATEGSVDCVLMDIMMPEMDGLETTARLRTLRGWDHVPIIGLSASVLPDQIEIYLKSGIDAFVPKPVDADALLATLREHLGQDQDMLSG